MYYIYAYLKEDKTPYYIGKGKDNRAYQKHASAYANPPKDESLIVFLEENIDDENHAFELEKYYIDLYGRQSLGTGPLKNRTAGGQGTSGMIHTAETKAHMSKIMQGNSNAKGCKHTPRQIENKRQRMLGNIHSEETLANLSQPLIIDDIYYKSMGLAANILKTSSHTIKRRLISDKWPNYKIIGEWKYPSGKDHPRSGISQPRPFRAFEVNGVLFEKGLDDAALVLPESRSTIRRRILSSKYPNWKYID